MGTLPPGLVASAGFSVVGLLISGFGEGDAGALTAGVAPVAGFAGVCAPATPVTRTETRNSRISQWEDIGPHTSTPELDASWSPKSLESRNLRMGHSEESAAADDTESDGGAWTTRAGGANGIVRFLVAFAPRNDPFVFVPCLGAITPNPNGYDDPRDSRSRRFLLVGEVSIAVPTLSLPKPRPAHPVTVLPIESLGKRLLVVARVLLKNCGGPSLMRRLCSLALLVALGLASAPWARGGDLRITLPKRTKPTPVQQLNRDGVRAIQKRRYDEAKKLFYKAYLLDPNDPFTLNNLGYIAELDGEVERAQRYYALAADLSSDATIAKASSEGVEGKSVAEVAGNAEDKGLEINRLNVEAMALLLHDRAPEAE